MVKLGRILKLSDPYLNFWYEIFCYVKAILGALFLIFGIFLIFHPMFYRINFFGLLETIFVSFFFFWRMKPLRPWKGGVSLWKTVSFLPHSSPPTEGRGILRREIKLVRRLAGK